MFAGEMTRPEAAHRQTPQVFLRQELAVALHHERRHPRERESRKDVGPQARTFRLFPFVRRPLLVVSSRAEFGQSNLALRRLHERNKIAPRHALPSLWAEKFEREKHGEEGESENEDNEGRESDSTQTVRRRRGNEVAPEDDRVGREFDEGPEEEGRRGMDEERV